MRYSLALLCLFTAVGCSRQPPTEHHFLPDGFSGVYKIVRSSTHDDRYTMDGNRVVFSIPEDGVLQVGLKTFEDVCLSCNGLSAEFADGQSIPLYAAYSPPAKPGEDVPMLLGVFSSGDTVWYAVGKHEQLTKLLAQIQEDKYQGLDDLLPPKPPPFVSGSPLDRKTLSHPN